MAKRAQPIRFIAVASAPTNRRPDRLVRGFGDTERDALADLARRNVRRQGEPWVVRVTYGKGKG